MKFLWIETLNIEMDTVAKEYRRDVKGKDKSESRCEQNKDIQNNSQQVPKQERILVG